MSGLLGYIYGRANALQRGLLDTINNPADSMAQTAGHIVDKGREQNKLMEMMWGDPQNPFRVTDPRAADQATMNMLLGPLGFAPAGITAWHGSPHTFNKFDSSKIGTGEGAQAYGHGLYLAESPHVADQYRVNLTPQTGGRAVTNDETLEAWYQLFHGKYGGKVTGQHGVVYPTADSVLKEINAGRGGQFPADLVKALEPRLNKGNLYKVDLPDDAVGRMLDWDKPVSQQTPAVRKALAGFYPETMTGREIYEEWAKESVRKNGAGADHNAYAANIAKQFGLPGVRYLDQGSRGTASVGGWTSNFVVFPGEENALKILERNGQPVR